MLTSIPIGDLAFGEAFGCLVKGEYHDWVRTLYDYLKAMTIAAAACPSILAYHAISL